LGESFLEKMEIDTSFFWENNGKLAHWRNLSPKIIYASMLGPPSFPIKYMFLVKTQKYN
jgi:hypothetical protein